MPFRELLHRPQSSRSPQPGSKPPLKHLSEHLSVGLGAMGWSLAHICFGALLFDFGAAPVIWILLIALSLLSVLPSDDIPLWLRRWTPAVTCSLVLVGITLPAWALFLTALPMLVLFVSLTLIGNQPVKASLINSLSVYSCSTLFISLVAFLLGLSQGERLSSGIALVCLSAAVLVLWVCTPFLGAWSRSRAFASSEQNLGGQHSSGSLNTSSLDALVKSKSLWLCGCGALACLSLGAWAIHSPWAIALVDPTI